MNAANIVAPSATNAASAAPQNASIWRRIYDSWIRSYESRISPDGKVYFGGM